MTTIRKQSIVSSIVVYIGFALGLLNTYLYTRKQSGFTEEQYGLTNTFIALASIMFSVAGVGMSSYVNKFFPYYKSHTEPRKNDQLAWALLFPCIGFFLVLICGIAFKGLLIDKIFSNSPELPRYYYWCFPFGFGYTLFMVLEAFAWQHRKAVLSNFLKEVLFRALVCILIVLTSLNLIRDFDVFIGIYSFLYLVLVVVLVIYFVRKGQFHIHFSSSKVTRRLKDKLILFISFVWGGGLIFNLASVFDGIVIAAVLPDGLKAAGIFYLAQNISSLIQAPQRAIISASVGPISEAWKDKNLKKINRIYHRSSINQLLFSCFMFCLIWLNFTDGVLTFGLKTSYLQAQWIFFFIGLAKIVDMGTGLNSQIIGASNYWRFEFVSGLILLAISLPLNWQLTRHYGMIGPAYSNLISFTIYNLIRYLFLLRKFHMQPFDRKTLFTLLLAFGSYLLTYYIFRTRQGIAWIALRSLCFMLPFIAGTLLLRLSPDVLPVWTTVKKRLGLQR